MDKQGSIEVSAQDIIDALVEQRNAAFNELAQKSALIKTLLKEKDEKKGLEDK